MSAMPMLQRIAVVQTQMAELPMVYTVTITELEYRKQTPLHQSKKVWEVQL